MNSRIYFYHFPLFLASTFFFFSLSFVHSSLSKEWLVSKEDFQASLVDVLMSVEEGDGILLPKGVFFLDSQLSLLTSGVTIRGAGMDQTILSFKNQVGGSEGLYVSAKNVTLESFSIFDTKGDAIKVMRSRHIVMRFIKVGWTGGPLASNGGYGFYPVQSSDVVMEDCVAHGASDSGFYVGQSSDVIIRRNEAFHNVSGINIENSTNVEAYDNHLHHNTAGLAVIHLPNLAFPSLRTRVERNLIEHNNIGNFGSPANIVGLIPQGTGIMLLATEEVRVIGNIIEDHQTTNFLLLSYQSTGRSYEDPTYSPYLKRIYIHHNDLGRAGYDPQGGSDEYTKQLMLILRAKIGLPFPQIVWDGFSSLPSKLMEELCLGLTQHPSFISLDGQGDFQSPSGDSSPYACTR